jgi:hypothetical protein
MPEDVIINCSKDSDWPKPPPGHKWKEVRHDNTVNVNHGQILQEYGRKMIHLILAVSTG